MTIAPHRIGGAPKPVVTDAREHAADIGCLVWPVSRMGRLEDQACVAWFMTKRDLTHAYPNLRIPPT